MSQMESFNNDTLSVIRGMQEQTEIQNELISAIPESLFKSYFLPLFRGDFKDDIQELEKRFNEWLQIAKSPVLEVRVCDDVTHQVLFQVPSIYYTKMFDPTKSEIGVSFKSLIEVAKNIGVGSPARMEQYLENDLNKKFNSMRQKGHVLENEENRWKTIFERYDSLPKAVTSQPNKPTQSFNNLTEDDFE